MKATYSSNRNGSTIIEINFKDSEYSMAEKAGQYLVDEYGFEWIHEEDGLMTVGIMYYTIAELREFWKEAKKALS